MRRVMIVAGEASGDNMGASFVTAARALDPTVSFFGVGGPRMREAGVDVVFESAKVAVVGAVEVLAHLGDILGVLRWMKTALVELKPDLVVLIDFPDFNFRLLRAAKKTGVPILWYVSPQVWAWRRGRAKLLAKSVARMAVIFPFETEIYRKHGLDAVFVGHPLMDGRLGPLPDRAASRARLGIGAGETVVALLPGSRRSEIAHHLPRMVTAATEIARQMPEVRFVMPVASTLDRAALEAKLGSAAAAIRLVDDSYDAMAAADASVVKSGTSTLEAALSGVPFVIVYRVSPVTYAIARTIVRIPLVGMVNIIAGREVAKELVQREFTPSNVAREVLALLRDPSRREAAKAGLAEVRKKMGEGGASHRVAALALELLDARGPAALAAEVRS